jgi:hypothetical protein
MIYLYAYYYQPQHLTQNQLGILEVELQVLVKEVA